MADAIDLSGRLDCAVNSIGIEGALAGGAGYVASGHGLIGLTTSVSAKLASQGMTPDGEFAQTA